MDETFKVMGNRIKIRRKELHMTQGDLAERLGTSDNHISGIETGAQKPSFPTFLNLCNELRVRPDYLLLGCMHSDNIEQNIIDTIHLCDKRDLELIQMFVNALAARNCKNWTDID